MASIGLVNQSINQSVALRSIGLLGPVDGILPYLFIYLRSTALFSDVQLFSSVRARSTAPSKALASPLLWKVSPNFFPCNCQCRNVGVTWLYCRSRRMTHSRQTYTAKTQNRPDYSGDAIATGNVGSQRASSSRQSYRTVTIVSCQE